MIAQLVSLVGAGMILGAYLAFQRGWLGRSDRAFHALNLVGSVLLTAIALMERQAGFIVLEGTWALLSLPGTIRPPDSGAMSVE